ncbi:hypothetical protein BDD12DRAFT_889025 [Trichophaea hybrida]|nr:hypothetical protein BDD12DRAFT_889025 [Trichophaea hybrida]
MESSQESSMNTHTQLVSSRALLRRIDAFNKPRSPLQGRPLNLRPAPQATNEPTKGKGPTTGDNRRWWTERSLSPPWEQKAPPKQQQLSGTIPTRQKGSHFAPTSIAPITGLWRDQPFFKKRLENHIPESSSQSTTPNHPNLGTPSGLEETARQWTEEVPLKSGLPRTLPRPQRTEQVPQLTLQYSPCPSIPNSQSFLVSPIVNATTPTDDVTGVALPRLWMKLGFVPETLQSLTFSISPPKNIPGQHPTGQEKQKGTSRGGENTTMDDYSRTVKCTKYTPKTVADWERFTNQEQEFAMALSNEHPNVLGMSAILALKIIGAIMAAQVLRRIASLFDKTQMTISLRQGGNKYNIRWNSWHKEKLAKYKKAVVDLTLAQKDIEKLTKENEELKRTIESTPFRSSTSEQVNNLTITITRLQKELWATKVSLKQALVTGSGRPEESNLGLESSAEMRLGMDWLKQYGIKMDFEKATISDGKKSMIGMLRNAIYHKYGDIQRIEQIPKERTWQDEVPKRYHKYAKAFEMKNELPETDVFFDPELIEGAKTEWKPYTENDNPTTIDLKRQHVKEELTNSWISVNPNPSVAVNILIALKKCTDEKRFCINFRPLNKSIKNYVWSIPLIDRLIQIFKARAYYEIIAIRYVFHHINVNPKKDGC